MDKYLEKNLKKDVSRIEDCLKGANIPYSIFTFGSCNTPEFGPNSDIDIGIVLYLPELHIKRLLADKSRNWLSGKGRIDDEKKRPVTVTRWVYGNSELTSPHPVDYSDFEKWGDLANQTRLKYMAKTYKPHAGKDLEELMERYRNEAVPAYEGIELFTICSRDLAAGRMDKAILRAVNALHIAAGYDSLNSYSEMLEVGSRLLPEHKHVLEWAHSTKKEGSINYFKYDEEFLKNVKKFFTAVKNEIQGFAMEADFKFDNENFNRLDRWFTYTAPGVVRELNQKQYGYFFADLFVKELLATAHGMPAPLGFLPKETNELLEDVNKKLDASKIENMMLSADITLVLGKPKEARMIANEALRRLALKAKSQDAVQDEAELYHTAARIEVGNNYYGISMKHYEKALSLQPHNEKLWAGAELVYRNITKLSEKAKLAQTIGAILNGTAAAYALETPLSPEISSWLGQLKCVLKEKIEHENERIQKVINSTGEKIPGTFELKINLLRDLKNKNEIILEKLLDPGTLQETMPLYRAFVSNKKKVWRNFQEIETIESKINSLRIQTEAKWNPS